MVLKHLVICTVLCILYFQETFCAPQNSLVVSSTEPPKEGVGKGNQDEEPVIPKIYEMTAETNVSNRFAKTLITSKVKNLAKTAQQATFSVVLPEKAFISGFTMEIEGKSYKAYVKEKQEAKKTYDDAVAAGQAAAHVSVNARDSNRFTVNINVEPRSKATFLLTYEELLQRQNSQYEVVLNIHPGQPVKNLNVQVNVNETRPLKFVKTPALRSGNEISKNDNKLDPHADINIKDGTTAVVKFSPDIERQKQLANGLGTKEENGLAGQFIVQYDVERDPQGGEVLLDEGYFVHFFAPSDLAALPKYVVFVLDTSGSMEGIRITQLKEAMNSILSELKPEDVFNIVEFNSAVKVWDINKVKVTYQEGSDPWTLTSSEKEPTGKVLPGYFAANEENIKNAMKVVKKLDANGGTDINSALKVGINLIRTNKHEKNQPLIIFLTDGEPTVGEVSTDQIVSLVTELNGKKSPIFSLSFGDGADKSFLQKISLKNLGFSRHIYEGADASLQLEEFYKQISSPLLTDIKFKYVSNVTELTKTNFPILFKGSEIVVAGIIDPGFVPQFRDVVGTETQPAVVECRGVGGRVSLLPKYEKPVTSLERLWAYLTVRQILEQRDAAENKTGPTQEALRIALKYSFVTDVTSLVVVKPNETNAVNTESASKTQGGNWRAYSKFAVSYGGNRPVSFHSALHTISAPRYGAPAIPATGYGAVSFAIPAPGYGAPGFAESYDSDAILPNPTSYFSTTRLPTSTVKDDITSHLPWISNILTENGTISTSTGTYDIGIGKTVLDEPSCPVTPTNTTGTCKLLANCPNVFSLLTDLQKFIKYSCNLQKFTGICCPARTN